jgi:hypothetical protein
LINFTVAFFISGKLKRSEKAHRWLGALDRDGIVGKSPRNVLKRIEEVDSWRELSIGWRPYSREAMARTSRNSACCTARHRWESWTRERFSSRWWEAPTALVPPTGPGAEADV